MKRFQVEAWLTYHENMIDSLEGMYEENAPESYEGTFELLQEINKHEEHALMLEKLLELTSDNEWVEEVLEETERYFEETPDDQVDLDLQKARSGSLQKLRGAVQMAANMLRRDNRSVREEAAEELEKALGEFIDDLSEDS